MAATSQLLVFDASTVATFKGWAQAISTYLQNSGNWTQTSDTGQVNWSTLSAVPGSGSYVYEWYQPSDGLTNFYLRVEYGNYNSSNQPNVRITVATATNGQGVAQGYVMGPLSCVNSGGSFPGTSTTVSYPCYFSSSPGRFSILMWRTNAGALTFGVERSVNSSGTPTGTHVTITAAGWINGGAPWQQQSLLFGVGIAPATAVAGGNVTRGGAIPLRWWNIGIGGNAVFNNSQPFDTYAPSVGAWDYQITNWGSGSNANIIEGQVFQVQLYGATRTYIATYSGNLGNCSPTTNNGQYPLCVRWD